MGNLEEQIIIPEWSSGKLINTQRLKELTDALRTLEPWIKQDNGIITEVFEGTYTVDENLRDGHIYPHDVNTKNKNTTTGLHLRIRLQSYAGTPFICYKSKEATEKLLKQFDSKQPDELLGKQVIAYLNRGKEWCIGILPSDGQKRHYNLSIDGHVHDFG